MGDVAKEKLNGIDTATLKQVMGQISKDPSLGKVKFQVSTTWKGVTKSETVVEGYEISGQKVKRIHTFVIDEPKELLGEDTAANPQEYLMGAMNACIMNTYVIAAAMKGVRLESVVMETEGELDLRGFLGIDKNVIAGYKELKYRVRLKGDGTKAQYEDIHKAVVATSPNYYNVTHAIKLNAELIIE
ncbi:MAG: OsmC family protein [bacterium]